MEKFEEPKIEVITFEDTDVITTSGSGDEQQDGEI